MIRIATIQEELSSLIGWRQSHNRNKQISDTLTESESGLFFQDAHPLCTLENISCILPEDYKERYEEWSNVTAYEEGDKVQDNGKVYVAIADNSNNQPSTSPTYWAEYNELSDYLQELKEIAISDVVNNFVNKKKLDKESSTLVERRALFDGAGRIYDTITPRGRLVGFEITPVRAMGVTTKIERLGLQMTGATGAVRLYLFHSSQTEPVKTWDVNFTKTNGGFMWFNLADAYMPYASDETNAGGSWYLLYNQNDLPNDMRAVNVNKDWSKEPCATCNVGDVEAWRELTKYIQIMPCIFDAPNDFYNNPILPDVATVCYTPTTSYGLNLTVSVGCDLTDFIIEQRQMFATAIQKKCAINVLRTLALNPSVRVNRNQSNASLHDILYEIDGNTAGREGGLGYDYKLAFDSIVVDTRGIDRICLSCNNRGVRYTTV